MNNTDLLSDLSFLFLFWISSNSIKLA